MNNPCCQYSGNQNNMGREEKKRELFIWFKCKGSGREAALKQIREVKNSTIRNNRSAEPCSVCAHRERKRAQGAAGKLDLLDLYKCQQICREMDLKQV